MFIAGVAPFAFLRGCPALGNTGGKFMRKLQVEQLSVHALRPYTQNARMHSRRQIKQIANSIRKFGFCNPVLIGDDLQIIAGHGRVEAAKLLGYEMVPAVRLSHLSTVERRAYVLADNRLAELAGWDREIPPPSRLSTRKTPTRRPSRKRNRLMIIQLWRGVLN